MLIPIWIKDINLRIMFHEIKLFSNRLEICKRLMFAMTSPSKLLQNEHVRTIKQLLGNVNNKNETDAAILFFRLGRKNTNVVEHVEILFPVRFGWIPFKFVFIGPNGNKIWRTWPLIGWEIFDFSSENVEWNSTKFDRSQISGAYTKFIFFRPMEKPTWLPLMTSNKGGTMYPGARYVSLWAGNM